MLSILSRLFGARSKQVTAKSVNANGAVNPHTAVVSLLPEETETENPIATVTNTFVQDVRTIDTEGGELLYQIQRHTAQKASFYADVLAAVRPNTRKQYTTNLRMFAADGYTIPATPPQLADYIRNARKWRRGEDGIWRKTDTPLSVATLKSHVAAVSLAHKVSGHPDPAGTPEVEMAMKAIAATRGTDPEQQAKPILQAELRTILGAMTWRGADATLADCRDAAILMLGWTAALRRSEIVGLDVENLSFGPDGVILSIVHSKNKQGISHKAVMKGRGEICPVRILQGWLDKSGIQSGPIFRGFWQDGRLRDTRLSGRAISDIVKHRAEAAGIELEREFGGTRLRISGHSLRAGFITSMMKAGVPDWKIAKLTGHADVRMLATYNREADLFVDNATDGVW